MNRLKHLFIAILVICGVNSFAQDRTVTGKIIDEGSRSPIAGATITLKGSKTAASSAADGSFSIAVPSGNVSLIVSSIGFATKVIVVAASTTSVDVDLAVDSKQLGEVVVTALGVTRQSRTLVYATQSVKPSQLTEVRDPNNILNSLQGKVANATITQGSGGPGSGARIVLRGNRSIQGSNDALIVVDGVPLNNDTYGTAGSDFGSVQGSDGASNINPDDIESVNILRGASAAALYGSQAGNGVIVITTKKGAKDRTTVTINSGVVTETPFILPQFQNTYGQGNSNVMDPTVGESWGAKMQGQSYTDYLGQAAKYAPQPDNVKDFFRTGTSFNNSIGISGGTEKMQTYLSYTNNSVQGIVPGNNLLRNTVNLRMTNQIGKRFSTDAKVTYISQNIKNKPRTGEENAPVIDIYQIPRNISLTQAQHYRGADQFGVDTATFWPSTLSSIYQNPYWMTNKTALNETRDRVIGFLTAKYKITDWLSIQGRANLDRTFDRLEQKYSQGTILWASQSGGYYGKTNLTNTNKWFDAMIEGENMIARDLKINYRAGAIYQDVVSDANVANADGLNVANKFSLNFASNPAISSTYVEVQTQSLFGQADFSYKDAIFLEGSYRNDWDSRLPSPYSYGYYSIGASAILSQLTTMPDILSFFKVNANYAEVGNGGQPQILNSTSTYSQGAGNGFLQRSATLPIPGLKPEIVKNMEFGVEMRFLNDRIGFNLTYYKSNSINQLLQIPLPTATGYSTQYINAGNIQNQGLELVVNGSPIRNQDFSWDLTLNLAGNRNKVIKLSDDLKVVYLSGGFGRSATPIVKEGGSYGDLLAYQWARNASGKLLVTDGGKPLTTDVNGEQQGYIGNFNPRATLGFTNVFTYKGFILRVLIDGRFGGVAVSGTEMNLAFSGITAGTDKYREGGWNLGGVLANGQNQNADSTISAQTFWQTASGKRYGVGEFFAYDVTNFRVRELSLGYDIPLKSHTVIKGIRISAVARNVFWIYRGSSLLDIPGLGKRKMSFDPDMSLGNSNYQGVEYGTLPSTRTLGLNLKLTF